MLSSFLLTAVLAAQGGPSSIEAYALRLSPGSDLKTSLVDFAKSRGLRAAFVMTTVGSLNQATLRLANQPGATVFPGKLEIVSLVGTFDREAAHLHLSIADKDGHTFGGHLLEGCPVYTTAEIVVGEISSLQFGRTLDKQTTYQELSIGPRIR